MGYAYNPNGGWTATHQISINGKFDNITRQDMIECAAKNNIKGTNEIIDQIKEAASNWEHTALECEVPKEMIKSITPNLLLDI